MKALVFEAPERPVVVDVPMPSIGENDVLVKTRAVGICHSDYELLGGRYIIPISYPVTPGHEWCGEIVEVGRSVKSHRGGDRVCLCEVAPGEHRQLHCLEVAGTCTVEEAELSAHLGIGVLDLIVPS